MAQFKDLVQLCMYLWVAVCKAALQHFVSFNLKKYFKSGVNF